MASANVLYMLRCAPACCCFTPIPTLDSLGNITPPYAIIGTNHVNIHVANLVHITSAHFITGWMVGPCLPVHKAGVKIATL